MDLEKTVRAEIKRRGLTGYRVAKDLGLSQSRVARFLRGNPTSTGMLSQLCKYLGLELVKKGKRG